MKTQVIKIKQSNTVITMVDKTVFEAIDGKQFDTESECLRHERKQELIRIGKSQFNEFNHLNDDQLHAILRLCFEAYGSLTDCNLVLWKSTQDKDKLNDAVNYLIASGFNKIYQKQLSQLKEDTLFVIGSWTEDEHTDQPGYCGSIILFDNIINQVNELQNVLTKNITI